MGIGFRALSLVMLAALPLVANAGDTIKVARVVPYMEDISATNLPKCDWNRKLPGLVSWKSGRTVEVSDADLASVEGKVLVLSVVNAHTAGGGSISGPKWGRVRGELRENGQLLGNFNIRRVSARPFDMAVCKPLDNIAVALAVDIAAWLKNPTINPDADKVPEPMPAE
jgi:hypothetical protein